MDSCTCLNAWNILQNDPNSLLVDVRTKFEWESVGIPSVDQNQLLLNSIRLYPEMNLNERFANFLFEVTKNKSYIFFLCKYGVRSLEATNMHNAQASEGYNLIDGFEGEAGWRKSGLPICSMTFEVL